MPEGELRKWGWDRERMCNGQGRGVRARAEALQVGRWARTAAMTFVRGDHTPVSLDFATGQEEISTDGWTQMNTGKGSAQGHSSLGAFLR